MEEVVEADRHVEMKQNTGDRCSRSPVEGREDDRRPDGKETADHHHAGDDPGPEVGGRDEPRRVAVWRQLSRLTRL